MVGLSDSFSGNHKMHFTGGIKLSGMTMIYYRERSLWAGSFVSLAALSAAK